MLAAQRVSLILALAVIAAVWLAWVILWRIRQWDFALQPHHVLL
jgi:membrane protein YdbS with pleckstrin-like domain